MESQKTNVIQDSDDENDEGHALVQPMMLGLL